MTITQTRIQQTETAIKVTEIAILKAKTYARRIYEEKIKRDLEQQLQELEEDYLNECIKASAPSWEGVDVDEFMDMVRGREPDIQQAHDEAVKENNAAWDSIIANAHARAIADELKNETNAQPETVAEESNDSEA